MDNIQTLVLKISQEVNMNMEETEMLQHDIWNLRGHEWAEVVKKHCTKETQELFEKLVFKSADSDNFEIDDIEWEEE
jgi:hypothetical protein